MAVVPSLGTVPDLVVHPQMVPSPAMGPSAVLVGPNGQYGRTKKGGPYLFVILVNV